MERVNSNGTICCTVIAYQVPNLFEPEEYEQVLNGTRPYAKEAGVPEGDRWEMTAHTTLMRRLSVGFLYIKLCQCWTSKVAVSFTL